MPQQVGPYEIKREIGRGGMGVVYLAHDTKLDRPVAIKVLPDELAQDEDRLCRFGREARMLASLSHANVAAIHGLEVFEGVHYLVLEYIDGEDLSDRLDGCGLPLDEALHIGKQITRAVEAAHAKGVIHRDLKPANVKVTVDGDVKVLDFGLAKAFDETQKSDDDIAASPTLVPADSPTMPGVILGTAGYMSPEQARGKPIDKRSDIWSFGCILYEMLTGKCPFAGESVAESLGATIHKEPEWNDLPIETPPNLVLLLHRCLQKDRGRRLQDIGDARVELDDTLSGMAANWTTSGAATDTVATSRRPGWPWFVFTTVLLVAAIGLSLLFARLSQPSPSVVRVSVPPPEGTSFVPHGDLAGPVVISPDGKTLAFTAMGPDGTRRIWIRPLDVVEARQLPGTEDAVFPFWSGDNRSVGFFADGLLQRVDVAGGTPITICAAPNGRGGTWNAHGDILFAPDFLTPIHRVPATGGTSTAITTLDRSRHTSNRWPSFLPDGRHFVYLAIHNDSSRAADNAVMFGTLDDARTHEVMRSSINAECTGDHLLFIRQGALMAVPFDARQGHVTSDPQVLSANVAYNLATWKAAFSTSPSGVIAYNPGGLTKGEGTKITTYDRNGHQVKEVSQVTSGATLRASPDGTRLTYVSGRAASSVDVWVYDIARDLPRRLTFLAGLETTPIWLPDGTEVLFSYRYVAGGDNTAGIYRVPAEGGTPQLVLEAAEGQHLEPESVSPDGRFLLFSKQSARDPDTNDFWLLPLEPPGEPTPIFQTPSIMESTASFSPDGARIVYDSDESGVIETYVTAFVAPSQDAADARTGRKWQISNGGGRLPKWSADGDVIYFVALDEMLMAVELNVEDGQFDPAPATPMLQLQLGPGNNFDVLPAGHIVASSADETTDEPVALILNWTTELD